MMTTPVVANDGMTYDRTSLQQHIDYAAQREFARDPLGLMQLALYPGAYLLPSVILFSGSCMDRWEGAPVAHHRPADE